MKVTCPDGNPKKLKVVDEYGCDLTGELRIRSLTITASGNDPVKLVLECYLDGLDVEAVGNVTIKRVQDQKDGSA